MPALICTRMCLNETAKRMSSGCFCHLFDIFFVLGTWEQARKERAAKKDYWGDGSPVLWSVGMVTQISLCCSVEKGGKEFWVSLAWWQAGDTHSHTHMKQVHNWVILRFKVEVTTTLSEELQRGTVFSLVSRFIISFCTDGFILSFRLLTYLPLFSISLPLLSYSHCLMAAWQFRQPEKSGWHICGPDICSRRQASCISRIGSAREGGK